MPPRKPCIERKADNREAVELINKHIRESVMQQARIMVAAPDLLAALKGLLACPAIADENHTDPEWGDPETAEAVSIARRAVATAELPS